MPKYIIEREILGAGELGEIELQQISEKSCSILKNMGSQIQWLESYVTANKLYCIYLAPDEKSIREHAELGGFPVSSIAEIKMMIDPSTAEIRKFNNV